LITVTKFVERRSRQLGSPTMKKLMAFLSEQLLAWMAMLSNQLLLEKKWAFCTHIRLQERALQVTRLLFDKTGRLLLLLVAN
jgi:uncharacterized alpha-E superfamily protein